jgi:hypothetical protein
MLDANSKAVKAVTIWREGDWATAELLLRRLAKEAPDFAAGRHMLATMLLAMGRWEEAWPHFEKRLGLDMYSMFMPLFRDRRYWRGEPVPAGSSLAVLADMGFGDILMCARFLPQAASRFASTTFMMPLGLKGLMHGQYPGIGLGESGEELPSTTHFTFSFDLPRCLGATPESLDNRPYLKADPVLVEQWRARLGEGFKVGVVWAGSRLHPGDAERSLKAAQIKPLLAVSGVRFVSLQRDASPEDLQTVGIEHDPAMTATFADMAAVMTNLDLVITVDSAPAHLAGALGRPVWIAVQYVADWRWLPGRPDTLWYQSARLFRAPKRFDMDSVIAAMADALTGIARV